MSKETFTFSLVGAAIPLSQLILVKELLIAFQGVETSLGMVLGMSLCWMAVGSLGLSRLGRGEKGAYRVLIVSQVFLSLLMPATVMAARLARHLVAFPDISSILHIALVITAPLSLLQGLQLGLAFRFPDRRGILWGIIIGAVLFEPAGHYLHPFRIIIPLGTLCMISTFPLLSHLLLPPQAEAQAPARTYQPGETLVSLREKLHRRMTFEAQYPQAPFAYHRFLFPKIDHRQTSRTGHSVYYKHRFSFLSIAVLFLTLLSVYLLLSNAPDKIQILSGYWQWGEENIIDSRNSSYGHLAVTSVEGRNKLHLSGQKVLTIGEDPLLISDFGFRISDFGLKALSLEPETRRPARPSRPGNGRPELEITPPQSAIRNPQSESPHSAFRNPQSKRVCLIGGQGLGEILAYPVESLDYVGLDPLMTDILLEYSPQEKRDAFFDPRVSLKEEEGRRFIDCAPTSWVPGIADCGLREEDNRRLVKTSQGKYDVVILTAPYPSTLRFNRFYTKEFFASLSGILEEDGLFFLTIPQPQTANQNPQSEIRNLLGATLGDVFPQAFFVQQKEGAEGFLCSMKGSLLSTMELEARTKEAGLDIAQIQLYPLQPDSTQKINRDLFPAFPGFKADKGVILALLLILLYPGLILWFRKKGEGPSRPGGPGRSMGRAGLAGLIAGFGGWAAGMILILGFQALYGHIYHRLGVIVAGFLIGTWLGMKSFKFRVPSSEARGEDSSLEEDSEIEEGVPAPSSELRDTNHEPQVTSTGLMSTTGSISRNPQSAIRNPQSRVPTKWVRNQKLAQLMLGASLILLSLILIGLSRLGWNPGLAETVFPLLAVLAGFLSGWSMPEITETARAVCRRENLSVRNFVVV
ncbi:MAG: hypothetical protein QME81_16425, partial [bacterium]|nr:hypothetical protein [bacterium]